MKKIFFAITLVLAVAAALILPTRPRVSAQAQPVVINFENVPTGQLTNQFANLGVTFNQPTVLTYPHLPGFTRSGTKAIEQCFAQEFCSTPLEISFTAAQRRVKLWVGYSSPLVQNQTVVLRALDAAGAQIGQATAALNASTTPQNIRIPVEVTVASARIRRVLLHFAAAGSVVNSLAVDDLEFDSAGAPPPCTATQNPTINIVQPTNGQTVQFDSFMLEVRVTSQDTLAKQFTLTNVGPGGATRSQVLPLNNGKYGPINFNGFLFPGLNTLTARFQDCRGTVQTSRSITYTPIPAGTRFEMLGIEVTQATQTTGNGVPLVANKEAVARVFLRIQSPLGAGAVINGVHGRLTAQRRSGTGLGDFLPPGIVRSLNKITVNTSNDLAAKRGQFNGTVNFELPAGWLTAGDLHLTFRPEIEGSPSSPSNLPCTNCDNMNPLNSSLPLFVRFQPTRPLNLILAPYVYQPRNEPPFPLSAELLITPAVALQWVNNVYPLAGNFPGNGDGIKLLRILPMRTTTRNMQTESGKSAFLGDLRAVYAALRSQGGLPSDVRLLGMVPCGCGGIAPLNGKVALVDTWASENGRVPEASYEGYGNTWAHELGHNFGREHAGNSHGEAGGGGFDPNFPFNHGSIGFPGLAINTEWWRPGGTPYFIATGTTVPLGRHAHDFMSYGHLDPLNTGMWVSPYTYSKLFDKFKLTTNATLALRTAPVEKLAAVGQINADGTVDLQPFYRTVTAFDSGTGATGEFSLELRDAKDRLLLEHRFDAQAITHEEAGTMGFTEFVPWQADAQRIVLKRGATVLAERLVSAHKPTVRVLSPNGGEALGAQSLITWEASDADGDQLSYTVFYNNGEDEMWWPLATGVTTTMLSVDTALWPGSAQGRIKVRVTDGVNTAEDVSDSVFTVARKNPLVGIINTEQESLTGVAYDPEDGLLPAASLVWTTDRGGLLEQGAKLKGLPAEARAVTLTATDRDGQRATAETTKRPAHK